MRSNRIKRGAHGAIAVSTVLLLAFGACGPKEEKPAEEASRKGAGGEATPAGDAGSAAKEKDPPAPKRPPVEKVLLVIIDALRADGLGCYGYDKPTSPTIDGMAEEGILFERVHSASPWTAPSFGTLYTGVSPQVHGAGAFLAKGSPKGETLFGVTVGGIRKDLPTLPEMLPKRLAKGALINNSFVSRELGFARGFDDFDHKVAHLTRYRTADEVTDAAEAWLTEHGEEPFFYVLHYFDPHIQYAPPEKYLAEFAPDRPRRIGYPFVDHHSARDGSLKPNEKEKAFIRGLYDGEVRFVDDEFARLMGILEKTGRLDDTWVLVISDHGEEHFDHGSFEHGHRYEEEVVRVPLIIRPPGGKWKVGSRFDTSISHVDVVPTLLDMFGVDAPAHLEGKTVMPIIEGEDAADRPCYMEYNLFNGQQCAYFDGRYKVVFDIRRNRGFMYDLKEDPGEKNQLGKDHPRYEELMGKLQAKRDELEAAAKGKIFEEGKLDEESAEALKSLGYIK